MVLVDPADIALLLRGSICISMGFSKEGRGEKKASAFPTERLQPQTAPALPPTGLKMGKAYMWGWIHLLEQITLLLFQVCFFGDEYILGYFVQSMFVKYA